MEEIFVFILVAAGAFLIWGFCIFKQKQSLEEDNARLRASIKCCEAIGDLQDKIIKLKEEEVKRREIIDSLIKEPEKTYAWIARAYADYVAIQEHKIANALYRKYDTLKSTETVHKISEEKEALTIELKNLQYRYEQLTHSEELKKYLQAKREEARNIINGYAEKIKNKKTECDKAVAEYNRQVSQLQEIKEHLQNNITETFPYLAGILSDIQGEYALKIAGYLETKPNPATKTAAEIKTELKREIQKWSDRASAAEVKLAYYETAVPLLEELSDDPLPPKNTEPKESDPLLKWLPAEQYRQLSETERNQRALDNYKNSHDKTRRQIGRDYERYVGWVYEQQGYKVEYKGILEGLEDLGRDLICRKDGHTIIVQCKYWSKEKLIHEKHINQLFGTYMHFMIEQQRSGGQKAIFDTFDLARGVDCKACFWTKTNLSETARAFADALNIEVHENEEIGDYPMIKCNISKEWPNEKIYHLPFDINYDKTIIEPAKGEFYANTVAEAEAKGFRRAYKWRNREG